MKNWIFALVAFVIATITALSVLDSNLFYEVASGKLGAAIGTGLMGAATSYFLSRYARLVVSIVALALFALLLFTKASPELTTLGLLLSISIVSGSVGPVLSRLFSNRAGA